MMINLHPKMYFLPRATRSLQRFQRFPLVEHLLGNQLPMDS